MPTAYDIITDRILAKLEAGVVPWHRPWGGQASHPRNLVSQHRYRGVNVFLLACQGYEAPHWLTFRQAKELGGHVRRGEQGSPVLFWKWLERTDEENGKLKRIPCARYYTVFNVAQVEGIADRVPPSEAPERPHAPIEAAERLVAGMPRPPAIRHDAIQACYAPGDDLVRLPRAERFESDEAYYSVLFHELTHSTGHSSRLNRGLDTELAPFGSGDYSREELVAEMGAAFLCGEAGILEPQIDQSAAYIDGWLQRLRRDRRLVVTAAGQAQRAADYILGRQPAGDE